jgi:hypothetical protein
VRALVGSIPKDLNVNKRKPMIRILQPIKKNRADLFPLFKLINAAIKIKNTFTSPNKVRIILTRSNE